MTSNWRWMASLLATFSAVLLAGDRPAYALTTSQTMPISLTISNSCTLATNPLSFGAFNPAGTNATTTLSINCTNAAAWSIDIDAGLNPGGANGPRRVTNGGTGASFVIYHLYKDVGQTQLWGSTTSGTAMTGTGTGAAQSITVYANAFGTQGTTPAGSYTDTVTVTVTF